MKKDLAVKLGAAALIGLAAPACHTAKEPAKPAPASAPATEPSTAPVPDSPTAQPKPDCEGKDKWTDACGYASPTRYAAVDPTTIRNS
jgi:hypothetical protein